MGRWLRHSGRRYERDLNFMKNEMIFDERSKKKTKKNANYRWLKYSKSVAKIDWAKAGSRTSNIGRNAL